MQVNGAHTMASTSEENHKIHPVRIIIAIILGIILLTIAAVLYNKNQKADAPIQPTTETRPNSIQNTPPNGSVTQDGDETSDTTPSSSGTGNNTLTNPAPGTQ